MDAVESKFEYINKNIEGTLKNVTGTFEELSNKLSGQDKDLNVSFLDKCSSLKSMIVTFFARIDKQVSDND